MLLFSVLAAAMASTAASAAVEVTSIHSSPEPIRYSPISDVEASDEDEDGNGAGDSGGGGAVHGGNDDTVVQYTPRSSSPSNSTTLSDSPSALDAQDETAYTDQYRFEFGHSPPTYKEFLAKRRREIITKEIDDPGLPCSNVFVFNFVFV